MFWRKANRIAELEQVVAGLRRRLTEADEQLAGIGGFEYEKVRRQVEELRAEARRILRDRVEEKARHENELAQRKSAHAITLARARAAVEAELDEVRRQVAEARQDLRRPGDDDLARPESLRPIAVDEAFAPRPRSGEPDTRDTEARADQSAP